MPWVTGVGPGDQVILNDPFAGGTHLNDVTVVAPVFVDRRGAGAGGLGRQPGPPRRPGRRRAGFDAGRCHRDPPGGPAAPAGAADRGGARRWWSPTAATPDERAGDLDAQVGANRVGVARLAALAGEPFDEVLDYGERRMRAVLARLPDGDVAGRGRPRLLRARPPTSSGPGGSALAVTVARWGDHLRLHRHRRPAARQRERGGGGDGVGGGLRGALGARSRPAGQRRRACGRCGWSPRRARWWPPTYPGRGRCRQRGGQPAGGRRVPRRALAQAVPVRVRGGVAGHHEQRAAGRPAPGWRGVGVLRDRRRRSGRVCPTMRAPAGSTPP